MMRAVKTDSYYFFIPMFTIFSACWTFQRRLCQDEFEKLWGEEVAETEDDVMSLAVSFLLVQVLSLILVRACSD